LGNTETIANRMIEFYNGGAGSTCFIGFTASSDLVVNNNTGNLTLGSSQNMLLSGFNSVTIHSSTWGSGVLLDGPVVKINPYGYLSYFGAPGRTQAIIGTLPNDASVSDCVSQINLLAQYFSEFGLLNKV
jgi:hypothetical protein